MGDELGTTWNEPVLADDEDYKPYERRSEIEWTIRKRLMAVIKPYLGSVPDENAHNIGLICTCSQMEGCFAAHGCYIRIRALKSPKVIGARTIDNYKPEDKAFLLTC